MKIIDIIKKLEKEYDKSLAYDFDNPGLNVGSDKNNVSGVLICLDVTNDTIDYAIKNKINLIISHHPMLFYKMQNVNDYKIDIKKVMRLIKNDISCYSMHTNFDVKAKVGMGDIVTYKIFDKSDIKKGCYIENVDKINGLGKVISLSKAMSISDILDRLIKNMAIREDRLRVYTKENYDKKCIKNIAILPGSGKSDVEKVIDMGVDLYLSGDLSHNNILDLLDSGISYIDCTHYGLEKIYIDFMYDKMKKTYKNIKIHKLYNEYL